MNTLNDEIRMELETKFPGCTIEVTTDRGSRAWFAREPRCTTLVTDFGLVLERRWSSEEDKDAWILDKLNEAYRRESGQARRSDGGGYVVQTPTSTFGFDSNGRAEWRWLGSGPNDDYVFDPPTRRALDQLSAERDESWRLALSLPHGDERRAAMARSSLAYNRWREVGRSALGWVRAAAGGAEAALQAALAWDDLKH